MKLIGPVAVYVDDERRRVLNSLSTGPGDPPHTFELTDGEYVYRVDEQWWLQRRGQSPVPVRVDSMVVEYELADGD